MRTLTWSGSTTHEPGVFEPYWQVKQTSQGAGHAHEPQVTACWQLFVTEPQVLAEPQVVAIDPGHDGWVVGDESVVVIDFHGASSYAKGG